MFFMFSHPGWQDGTICNALLSSVSSTPLHVLPPTLNNKSLPIVPGQLTEATETETDASNELSQWEWWAAHKSGALIR